MSITHTLVGIQADGKARAPILGCSRQGVRYSLGVGRALCGVERPGPRCRRRQCPRPRRRQRGSVAERLPVGLLPATADLTASAASRWGRRRRLRAPGPSRTPATDAAAECWCVARAPAHPPSRRRRRTRPRCSSPRAAQRPSARPRDAGDRRARARSAGPRRCAHPRSGRAETAATFSRLNVTQPCSSATRHAACRISAVRCSRSRARRSSIPIARHA